MTVLVVRPQKQPFKYVFRDLAYTFCSVRHVRKLPTEMFGNRLTILLQDTFSFSKSKEPRIFFFIKHNIGGSMSPSDSQAPDTENVKDLNYET